MMRVGDCRLSSSLAALKAPTLLSPAVIPVGVYARSLTGPTSVRLAILFPREIPSFVCGAVPDCVHIRDLGSNPAFPAAGQARRGAGRSTTTGTVVAAAKKPSEEAHGQSPCRRFMKVLGGEIPSSKILPNSNVSHNRTDLVSSIKTYT